MARNQIKTAKQISPISKVAKGWGGSRTINVGSDWKKEPHDLQGEFQGIQVFYPVDPYTPSERKEFRTAMNNVYVYRAVRILTTFITGQGYTTEIVPRTEEEIPEEQLQMFGQQPIEVPYWNKTITMEQLKDKIDKMAIEMDLATNVFNAYYTTMEQGRCALALTPLDPDEETGKFKLPEMIRYIRPEFTLRPILDGNTSEMIGLYVIGSRSRQTPSAIPNERLIYMTHGFNNELFSDYYGDSKIARISDIANNLNLVLNQDYERVAESTWHQPKVWLLPIPPQDVGSEESIVSEFLKSNNENAKGKDIGVAVSAINDERIPSLANAQTNSGNIGGLEIIRTGLIKAIITAFGLPGFMLSEGDIGKLGGNANIEEVDMFLNTEVAPERIKIEKMVEAQFYDRILCILLDIEDPEKLPIKIKHKYNKPTLLTLLSPQMIESMEHLVQNGWIDPVGFRDILHLTQYQKETMSKGEFGDPNNRWSEPTWDDDSQEWVNSWGERERQWNESWGNSPNGWSNENGWNNEGSMNQWNIKSKWAKSKKTLNR